MHSVKKIVNLLIVMSFVIILLGAGCTRVAINDEIVLGVAWPFESLDGLLEEGIDLAVQKVNDEGGIQGKTLRLIKMDDGSELERGMAIAQSFTENEQVIAVIGHCNSFISIPASMIYEQAGVVMLSPSSTSPKLTQNNMTHIFRNIPSDDEIARQVAMYLGEQGFKRMVIYYSEDSYGNDLAKAFEDHARSQGITIVDRFNYYTNQEDLRRMHKKWQAFGFDGIFIAKSVEGGAHFLMDARAADIEVPFVAGNSLDSPRLLEIASKAAEGLLVGSVFNPSRTSPETKEFVEAFQREYHQLPTPYAANGYDAVLMLAAALEKSNLNYPTTVAEELRNLGPWRGVAGIHHLNDQGDDIGDLVVLKRVQNGKFEYVDH